MIRVFPTRNHWTPTDDLAFVGFPPMFRPGDEAMPVRVSVTFTWERDYAERIAASWRQYYRDVQTGGPAYDDPGGEFVPGRFMKLGCTITSRGCPKNCGWCSVPGREGNIRLLPIRPGWIVQDNNLLATPEHHFAAVFEMLRAQDRAIYFNGGLDKHFLKEWHVPFFASIPIGELWWALDEPGQLKWLARVRDLFPDVPQRKMRCYTMIGYGDETLAEAERRVESVFEMGFAPFTQLYQPPQYGAPTKIYPLEWKRVARKWSRPAAYMGKKAREHASND